MLENANKNGDLLIVIVMLAVISALLVGCNEATTLSNATTTAVEIESQKSDQRVEKEDIEPDGKNTPPAATEVKKDDATGTGEITPTIPPISSSAVVVDQTSEVNPETASSVEDDSTGEQIKQETRALWSRLEVDEKSIKKADLDALVAQMDQARLNVLLFKVYHKGTAYFELSETRFPDENKRLPNRSSFSTEGHADALSYLLAIRDERREDGDPFNDFEVHAWFSVMWGGDRGEGWPQPDKTKPYMLHALFPEFKLKYGAYYLKEDERFARHDTSVVHQPKFRDYMVNLITGMVEDYRVDGVHLDHIRTNGLCFNNDFLDYPGDAYDYPGCQEDYKTWTRETYGREYTLWEDTDGHKVIQDGGSGRVAAWQERAMNVMVKEIHDELNLVDPEVIISVASVRSDPSPEARKQEINGQTAWEWLDKGWIDAAFVATYTSNTQRSIDIIQRFREAIPSESKRLNVFPGLLTYNLNSKEKLAYLIVEQVNAVTGRQWTGQPLEPAAKGFALFRAEHLSQEAIEALAAGPFKVPASPYWGETDQEPVKNP